VLCSHINTSHCGTVQAIRHSHSQSCEPVAAGKDASKPKLGTIFSRHMQDRLLICKKRIREEQFRKIKSYTNNLHKALLCKSGPAQPSGRAGKINKTTNIIQVDGTVDKTTIFVDFAKHFESICKSFNAVRNEKLKDAYNERRVSFTVSPIIECCSTLNS